MKNTLLKYLIVLMSFLPLRLARACGWLLGEFAWQRRGRAATTTSANLRACFPQMPDDERRCLARQSLHNWGMTVFESPVIWRQGPACLTWLRVAEGGDLVRQALASGRGLILLCPHLGNWEMTGLWLSTQGPTTNLYQPPRQLELETFIKKGRSSAGARLVPTNRQGVAAIIKALQQGEITGILPDMEPEPVSGVFAPFFGVPALTMTLVHSLIKRTGARVVLGLARRIPGGFEMIVVEPDNRIYSEDAVLSVTALNRGVETLVQRAPEQYQWEYKRFKKRPAGEKPIYVKK